jgi:hypothetical protein
MKKLIDGQPVWKNAEKIKDDLEFVKSIALAGKSMCHEVRGYPLPIKVDGDFEKVVEQIRQQVPMNLFTDRFEVGEYTHNNGKIHEHLGTGVMRDFIRREKEKLYAKTDGRITDQILLEKESFLQAVKVKDPFALLESVHKFFVILKRNPDSRQRCKSLLSFQHSVLIVHPDASEAITNHHSIFATDGQVEFYNSAQPHLEALKKLGSKQAIMAAIDTDDPEDRRWLQLIGSVEVRPDNDERTPPDSVQRPRGLSATAH